MKNSLKIKLLYYISISVIILLILVSIIFLITMNLQRIADQRFENEQYMQKLQSQLAELQSPLQGYLSTWSSDALSKLLFLDETINEAIPDERPVHANEQELMKREIFFLIESYLEKVDQIIELKRGKKVQEYYSSYGELSRLYDYINSRIDAFSLFGFRVQLNEYRDFLKLFRNIQMYNLLLILSAVAFVYTLFMQMVNKITSPMYQLSQMAMKLSDGNFDLPDIHLKTVNEVDQVANAFNTMKNSIHHYIKELQKQKKIEKEIMNERVRNLKMEQLLKRMELYTMQARMNPHFLFNTINTGVQLAIVEEADRTAEFMENLAALFRYNVRENRFFVPLRNEIDGLISYFNILTIRFPKTLKLNLDVQEELLDQHECPALIIQPLVENSVLHAFNDPEKMGAVTVKISYEDPVLVISVHDNGIGIPDKTVKALLVPHTHDYQLSSKVMGLENVIQRCYFFYPEQEDVISIVTDPGKGTEIIIRIHTEVEPCIEL